MGETINKRDFLFDNAKGILIIFVVLGHFIEPAVFKSSKNLSYVYSAIYTFHMPIFVYISGYFSKKHNNKKILELLFMYAIWQLIIFPMFVAISTDSTFTKELNSLFKPEFTYWYLLSLIWWRILTPYIINFKNPLILTIILSLLIGISNNDLNLNLHSFGRTFTFFPFFIAGYLSFDHQINNVRKKINKHLGLLGFIAVITIGSILIHSLSHLCIKPTWINRILYGKYTFDDIFFKPYIGIIVRLIIMTLQFLAIYLFLTFIPKTKQIITKFGKNSMYIFLTHGMIIHYLKIKYFSNINSFDGSNLLIVGIILSILFCLTFSSKLTIKPLKYLTSLNLKKFITY